MTQRINPQPAKQSAARAFCAFNLAAFTIGTKSVNTINVAVQLEDARGQPLKQIAHAKCYLSDNADGSTLTGTACTSPIAIGTNGVLLDTPVSAKLVEVLSDALGRFDLNLIQTVGGTSYYLVIMLPDGGIVVSTIITF